MNDVLPTTHLAERRNGGGGPENALRRYSSSNGIVQSSKYTYAHLPYPGNAKDIDRVVQLRRPNDLINHHSPGQKLRIKHQYSSVKDQHLDSLRSVINTTLPSTQLLLPDQMENSSFSRLPPELRNMVYELALYEPNGSRTWHEPGLLRTCKAIRCEAELMFYAVNTFLHSVHEDHQDNSLCKWLDTKAGKRIQLIHGLTIHEEMPSLNAKDDALPPDHDAEKGDEWIAFLMRITDTIRLSVFGGHALADRVRFFLNGASDEEDFAKIGQMPLEDQDRYRGAKFMKMCLIHGEERTLRAMEAANAEELLVEMDAGVQQRREVAKSRILKL